MNTLENMTPPSLSSPPAPSGRWGPSNCLRRLSDGVRSTFTFATLLVIAQACTLAAHSQSVTVSAAGDIACSLTRSAGTDHCQMAATAALVAGKGVDAVLTLGDNQYSRGRYGAYQDSYDPTWGRFRDITYPVPSDHEYMTPQAEGYYQYFGEAAGDPQRGYYSFDLGSWHIIALNSNCREVGGCGEGSPQLDWLRRDLAEHPSKCTLAYWHHPRFSSGRHGGDSDYQAFWQALYQAGADVVLAGHDHHYERFAPQTPSGEADPNGGLREFVVGTGGKSFYEAQRDVANSEVIGLDAFGVLFLNLRKDGYSWSFESATGSSFRDAGRDSCH